LQPQPVFLGGGVFVEPIEKFAVGIATVIDESQWRRRLQQFSAGQFHAIARVGGMFVHHLTCDLAYHDARFEAAGGKNSVADVGRSDPEEAAQTISIRLGDCGWLAGHGGSCSGKRKDWSDGESRGCAVGGGI
jgi:hypothetical protein